MDENERPEAVEEVAAAEEAVIPEENGAEPGKEDNGQQERGHLVEDVKDFIRRFPDVDFGKVTADPTFLRFCGSRFGREPLGDLFEDFKAVAEAAGSAARASMESKSRRTTGAGSTGTGRGLTVSQQRELDEWNRTYPGMKMTAKEFLSR